MQATRDRIVLTQLLCINQSTFETSCRRLCEEGEGVLRAGHLLSIALQPSQGKYMILNRIEKLLTSASRLQTSTDKAQSLLENHSQRLAEWYNRIRGSLVPMRSYVARRLDGRRDHGSLTVD